MEEVIPATTSGLTTLRSSVPTGTATNEVLQLGLRDALDRALQFNLGILLGDAGTTAARGARWKALNDMLPNVNARVGESVNQINLAAFGFTPPPGSPTVVGPFSVFDARATYSQRVLDLSAMRKVQAANENVSAARYSYQQARETVVLVVADLYLRVLTAQARVESAQAQFRTANELLEQARHMKESGVAAGIDVLRAQVQAGARQQFLIATQNDLEQEKLALARAIGLPLGQKFVPSDRMPDAPQPSLTLEQALAVATDRRPDYQQAQALVRAAEKTRSAASAERLPYLAVNGDYGSIGRRPTESHGTFTAQATLQIPIFQGGKVKADELQSEALLKQRRAEAESLKGRIDAEVRTAFMDMESSARQVEVAKSSVELANQQMVQARDRFAAGVSNSVEVTQAQDALAVANENYVSSVYLLNVAKARLALAVGSAEKSVKEFLGGSQ